MAENAIQRMKRERRLALMFMMALLILAWLAYAGRAALARPGYAGKTPSITREMRP